MATKEKREMCEGCDRVPATTYDSEGIPLCKECARLTSDDPVSQTNKLPIKTARSRSSELVCSELVRPLALTPGRRDKLCSKLHYDIMTARIQLSKISGYCDAMDNIMFRLSVDAPSAALEEVERTRRKRPNNQAQVRR